MADATLILLQKNASLLNGALEQALGKPSAMRLVLHTAPPLPQAAYGPQGLVVWDVAGFDSGELREMARELSSDRLGLLLAGGNPAQAFPQVLHQVKPLGIVIPAESPLALGVMLELAWANHRRRHQLRENLDRLRRELSDRLVVEKAKKLIMESLGYCEDEAMRRLQRYSRNTNQKLARVAQQLIAGYDVLGKDD